MKRVLLLLASVMGGCYSQTSSQPVPAAIVNDTCGANGSQETCAAGAGCEWHAVNSECPAGTACPEGVCVTPDACTAMADRERCEADTRCAWSALRLASASIDLCPVGQSCAAGGYCHARDASGGGCTCVQPIACPANAACPAVQCDCSNPPPGGAAGGGGGTCTCACPTCAPGQACPPCTCDCGSGGGGSCGGAGGGTCTCACPTCAPGAICAPCDCACGSGNVGVTTTTMVAADAPAGATVDPCAGHGDATACAADGAHSCSWIELGIVCVTTPCPSGACVQVKPVPDGGPGGCGCACAACIAGQSCPPCACNCCGRGTDMPPAPVPVPPVP